ncbi:MAG: hypothetical protein LBH30_06515 [Prevotellaceae bacterium]|jgi:hypothetical protein|nr:hypothetical protein [Prevotellaceae bacterium]
MNDLSKETENAGETCTDKMNRKGHCLNGKKIMKYLRELSVVVIGIAITLSANNWLTARSEKKDMALYFNAVKLELETNLHDLEWLTGAIEKEINYSMYLLSHDKNTLDPDSIQYYADDYYLLNSVMTLSNAFEMFKISGSMRFVKDKEVLLSLWNAYIRIEETKMDMDIHNREKYEEIKKEKMLEQAGKPVAVPMYDFYTLRLEYTLGVLYGCKNTKSTLEEALAKIDTAL